LLENLQILQKVWNIQRILLKHELGINDAKHMGVIKVAKDCKAIGCKWVFRTKRNAQG
jgi:hypothetical protein